MLKLLRSRLETGLGRANISKTSEWACQYRFMGKPYPGRWSFEHHPWLLDMHDSRAELNIGQKAAQMGFTEVLLNWSLKNIDIDHESVLYILPTSTIATEFTVSRFDPALELSPHLSDMFSDVRNAHMKRAGSAILYIRGSRVRNQLISVPVARVAVDELEECAQDNIPAVNERMSGQTSKQSWYISTPIADDLGINSHYNSSTKEHYFFKCPHCGRFEELRYPDSLVITTDKADDELGLMRCHYICTQCRQPLDHEKKAEWLTQKTAQWVAERPSITEVRGFHINQMYSHTVSPRELARQVIKSRYDVATEQELYNQKLGLPRIVRGGRIELEDIQACTGQHLNGVSRRAATRVVTMGIDVGKVLHYEVDEWMPDPGSNSIDVNERNMCRTLEAGTCTDFADLDIMLRKWMVNYAVIDANPETRQSMSFCKKYHGMSAMCYYIEAMQGRDLTTQETDNALAVKVDRSAWLDMSLGRFFSRRITIPLDVDLAYKNHLRKIVKVYKHNDSGGIVARYVTAGTEDHFAHARNYSEIAFKLHSIGGGYR